MLDAQTVITPPISRAGWQRVGWGGVDMLLMGAGTGMRKLRWWYSALAPLNRSRRLSRVVFIVEGATRSVGELRL